MMSNMKTASVRQVQHGLGAILEQVRRGQEIAVTKRGEVIARIVPARALKAGLAWPNSLARMKRLFPSGIAPGTPASVLIRDTRQERL
jgi:prevent-host-death family protein